MHSVHLILGLSMFNVQIKYAKLTLFTIFLLLLCSIQEEEFLFLHILFSVSVLLLSLQASSSMTGLNKGAILRRFIKTLHLKAGTRLLTFLM